MVKERQVFVTWYKPEEKPPEEGVFVVVTLSGTGPYTDYYRTLMIASWDANYGWDVEGLDSDTTGFTVHAWCDLQSYGG